jgi:hypothetical protein
MMQHGPDGCPSGPFAQRRTALLPAVSAATAKVTASEVATASASEMTTHGRRAAVVAEARIDIARIIVGIFRVHKRRSTLNHPARATRS